MMDWQPDLVTSRELLLDPTTSAIVVMTILIKYIEGDILFGTDDELSDPLEVWYSVREKFNIDLPVENENKINAIMAAMANDAWTQSRAAFHAIVLGMIQGDVDSLVDDDGDEVSVGEIADCLATVGVLMLDEITFSKDVRDFITDSVMRDAVDPEAEPAPDYLEDVLSDFAKLEMPEDMIRQFAEDWCIAEKLDHSIG